MLFSCTIDCFFPAIHNIPTTSSFLSSTFRESLDATIFPRVSFLSAFSPKSPKSPFGLSTRVIVLRWHLRSSRDSAVKVFGCWIGARVLPSFVSCAQLPILYPGVQINPPNLCVRVCVCVQEWKACVLPNDFYEWMVRWQKSIPLQVVHT